MRVFLPALVLWPLSFTPVFGQSTGTATVTITVTPGVTRSLSVQLVTGATAYDLGALPVNNTLTVGTTAFLVTNTGNISLTYSLQISSESDPNPGGGANPIAAPGYPWASADSAVADLSTQTDKYKLFAVFDATTAVPLGNLINSDTHLVKKAVDRLAGGPAGQFASVAQNGLNVSAVPGSNERGLFFAINPPAYTTTPSTKHIGVTVSAQ